MIRWKIVYTNDRQAKRSTTIQAEDGARAIAHLLDVLGLSSGMIHVWSLEATP